MNLAVFVPLISMALCAADENPAVHADSRGSLALANPIYAETASSPITNAAYAVGLLLAIAFINIPKKSFESLQYCTVSLIGVYFGTTHILQSAGWGLNYLIPVAGLGAVVAAVLSYNKEFRDLFFSAIAAYGTTYFIVLISRMESFIYAAVIGAILFFAYLFVGRMKEDSRLLVAMAKADVTSLGFVTFVNVWGVLDLFGGMHGLNATEGLVSGFLIGGLLILVVFTVVFVANYFQEWTEERMNSIKG